MSADNFRNCPKCDANNFREDYEIYSEEDVVYIEYTGYCKDCKHLVEINETRDML